MKFMLGKFSHESNAFCEHTTGEAEFKLWELTWGNDFIEAHQGKQTVTGGFIDGLTRSGHEFFGSVAAMTAPSGPVQAAFYNRIKNDLVNAAQRAGELDGILLDLHGAMAIEENARIFDPEGDLISALRNAVGPEVAIAAVFDLHSDTSDLLLDNADITLAYNEEPHRDGYERGLEAAELIQNIIKAEIFPTQAREWVPMLLPAINMATIEGPMRDLHELRAELEENPNVIDISIHPGFYGADQPNVGFSVICTTNNDPELAKNMARQVATAAWKKRDEFIIPLTSIEDSVRQGLENPEPVGLIDEADDPAGGGSGDSVEILRGMLKGGVTVGGISTITDPEVINKMAEVGEGKSVKVFLGGKTDSLHGDSLEVEGIVRKIFRDPIPLDSWSGQEFDMGLLGVLDVNGIMVVVAETKIVTENFDIFDILGIDVRKMQVVSFKGLGLHIRQALEDKIQTFILVDGIGITHPDVRRIGTYKHIQRPIWPLNEISIEAYPDKYS